MRRDKAATAMLVLALSSTFAIHANAECYWKAYDSPKGNTLYLYFPESLDEGFPEFGIRSGDPLLRTSPLQAFDATDLSLVAGSGSTDLLRQAVFDVVVDDYCEFSVNVVQTTNSPASQTVGWNSPCPEERCQVIGIGTDSGAPEIPFFGGKSSLNHGLADLSPAEDLEGGQPQNVARVWGTTVLDSGDPGQFTGDNSTLSRWARSIGHVASHEAGHNYGLGHALAKKRPDSAEDGLENHILATGGMGLTIEDRAKNVRHFSDQSYEVLGHNIGLNIKTVHNWDFTNPNEKDAHSLTVTLLSEAEDLTMSWSYKGSKSPWTNAELFEITDDDPTTDDLVPFQGKDYREYEVRFADPQSWNGTTPGVVPAGKVFHIGATFQESDTVIVYETTLYGSDGGELPLHPRMIGYEVGPPDPENGDVSFNLVNTSVSSSPPGQTPGPGPGPSDLQVQDLRVFLLPRLADINTMVDRAELKDIRGLDVQQRPLQGGRRPPQSLTVGAEPAKVIIANMNDARHVDITYDATDCTPGFVPADAEGGEIVYCPDGTSLSLFPSTYVYVTATIVDPKATHFDVAEGKMVTGPVVSKLFYQVAGIVPDLNENGVDDLLDIRSRTSSDNNKNGVPDEAEPQRCRRWPFIVGILAVILILWWFLRRRR